MKYYIKNRLAFIMTASYVIVIVLCGCNEKPSPPISYTPPTPLLHDYLISSSSSDRVLYNSGYLNNLTTYKNSANTEAALNALDSKATLLLKISTKGKPYAVDIAKLARNVSKNPKSQAALAALVLAGIIESINYISDSEEKEIKNNTSTLSEFNTLPILSDEELNRIMSSITNNDINLNSTPSLYPLTLTESQSNNKSSTPSYYKIKLENNSRHLINVAIRYQDKNKVWKTRGWWQVNSNEILETDINATSQKIYVHAYNDYSTWGNNNYYFYVINDKFTFKEDDYTYQYLRYCLIIKEAKLLT